MKLNQVVRVRAVADHYNPGTQAFMQQGTVGTETGFGGQRICVDGVWWDRHLWQEITEEQYQALK